MILDSNQTAVCSFMQRERVSGRRSLFSIKAVTVNALKSRGVLLGEAKIESVLKSGPMTVSESSLSIPKSFTRPIWEGWVWMSAAPSLLIAIVTLTS